MISILPETNLISFMSHSFCSLQKLWFWASLQFFVWERVYVVFCTVNYNATASAPVHTDAYLWINLPRRIHSSLTAVHWESSQEGLGKFTGCCYITEILLKTTLNTIQSINRFPSDKELIRWKNAIISPGAKIGIAKSSNHWPLEELHEEYPVIVDNPISAVPAWLSGIMWDYFPEVPGYKCHWIYWFPWGYPWVRHLKALV